MRPCAMGRCNSLLVLALLLAASVAGCLGSPPNESMLDLVVEVDAESGTIVETYVDGDLTSLEAVNIEFDFSKTTSTHDLTVFGLDLLDGSPQLTVDASQQSVLSISFEEHGIHNVSLFATDNKGAQQSQLVSIRVDLRIDWSEANTNNPTPLAFNPTPSNGGVHPIMIEVNSTVENPSLIDGIGGGGQTVQFSWNIVDELNDVCQSKSGQAEDGSEDTWNTVHFNTYLLHELRVTPEEGQDYLNVFQTVSVIYNTD